MPSRRDLAQHSMLWWIPLVSWISTVLFLILLWKLLKVPWITAIVSSAYCASGPLLILYSFDSVACKINLEPIDIIVTSIIIVTGIGMFIYMIFVTFKSSQIIKDCVNKCCGEDELRGPLLYEDAIYNGEEDIIV